MPQLLFQENGLWLIKLRRSERWYLWMILKLGIARGNVLHGAQLQLWIKQANDMIHALVSRHIDYKSIVTCLQQFCISFAKSDVLSHVYDTP
jgi:hypothetical protein